MARRPGRFYLTALLLFCQTVRGQILNPVLRTARGHPMEYYLSLPHGWSRDKLWPVVVTLDGSGKQWLDNASRFAKASSDGHYPFIIVTPLIVTNGGGNLRVSKAYNYTPWVWDRIDRAGACDFDISGLDAILTDMRQLYGGDRRYFITGFSAGGHLAWTMLFKHPENLAGVALVEGNYIGRCIDQPVELSPRADLPVRIFQGDSVVPAIATQTSTAMALASAQGYRDITRTVVPGMKHVISPAAVLEFFNSLLPVK